MAHSNSSRGKTMKTKSSTTINILPNETKVKVISCSHNEVRTGEVVVISHHLPNFGGYSCKKLTGKDFGFFLAYDECTDDLQQELL